MESPVSIHRFNVPLLILAQACFLASSMTNIAFGGLAGGMLAADPAWATLPVSLTVVSTALVTGRLSGLMQRTSRQYGFRIGAFSGLAGALLAMLAIYLRDYWLLCLSSLLFGPFNASAQYYRFAASESVTPAEAPRAMSYVMLGGIAAAFVVPAATSWLNDALMPYSFLGAYLFIVIVTLLVQVPIGLMKPVEATVAGHESGDGEARPLGAIVRTSGFIAAFVNCATGYAMMSFVMTATPLAMESCGLLPGQSATVIQGHVVAMFLPSLFTGRLIERFGVTGILFAGHAFFVAAFLLALEGIEVYNFSLALIALGIGWNFCFIGGSSLLTHVHRPSEKGRVQGLNETMVFTVTAVASLGAGIALNTIGWAGMNMLTFGLLAVAFAATLYHALKRTKPSETDPSCCSS
ncbi:MFS transporter [Gimibacter soli]|uniref:MFS transporter n=1 Tax=Gimibacter soli TaxID=3024400 RepID=A0AAF0BIF6_9PROT|nr:MFS transporter [Gimibacter soli]WCL55348.1 MFS transporter [Gimibacter soli]